MVRYTDECTAPEELRRYRKKPGVFGYVRSTDLFEAGTQFKIRTLEGDVYITGSEDIYIMIGLLGEVYPMEKSVFESRYKATDEPFVREFEYAPSVIHIAQSKPYDLMPLARKCYSGAGAVILAKPMSKFTKVFTRWDYEGYMVGGKDDMLCYTEGNSRDVYVVRRDIFNEIYEQA